MSDRLAEYKTALVQVKAGRAANPHLYPADFDWVVEVLEEAWQEVERLQRFEAMWEDCRTHRDNAERRARQLQETLQQVAKLVAPDEDDPL
jgi:hypothetical protein